MTRSYDPRPHNRQADLALRKQEFDADTAQMNRRITEQNQAAQRRHQQAVAKQAKPKAAGKEPGWLASRVEGLRRRLLG